MEWKLNKAQREWLRQCYTPGGRVGLAMDDLDAAETEIERLEKRIAELEALQSPSTFCPYCFSQHPPGLKNVDWIQQHIEICEKHPLCAARRRISELESELAALRDRQSPPLEPGKLRPCKLCGTPATMRSVGPSCDNRTCPNLGTGYRDADGSAWNRLNDPSAAPPPASPKRLRLVLDTRRPGCRIVLDPHIDRLPYMLTSISPDGMFRVEARVEEIEEDEP